MQVTDSSPPKDEQDRHGTGHHHPHRHRGGQQQPLTLDRLSNGHPFRILRLTATGEIRQRLADMGFIRGATGRILREALFKDPIELEMLDYKVSLRRAEARHIIIEDIE